MKIFFAFLLILSLSAHAAREFDCRDGDEVATLTLDKHSATVLDVTMINMMKMDWRLPYRSYARIGDPWFNVDVDMDIMHGKKGYAILEAHRTDTGERVVSRFYECTPKK
jgi:hypothetical protein